MYCILNKNKYKTDIVDGEKGTNRDRVETKMGLGEREREREKAKRQSISESMRIN